jgi:hypothetical protein
MNPFNSIKECLLTLFEKRFGRMPISADEFVLFCKSLI